MITGDSDASKKFYRTVIFFYAKSRSCTRNHVAENEKVPASTPDGFGVSRRHFFRVWKRKRLRQSAGHYGAVQCFLGVFEKR